MEAKNEHGASNAVSAVFHRPKTESESRLIAAVHRVYCWWARFIVARPLLIVTACMFLTLVCTTKVFLTRQRNTLHGWTPYGSRSLAEWEAKDRFFDQDDHPLAQILLIEAKRTGGNLLTLEALKEVVEVDDIVRRRFKILNRSNGKLQTFDEFCTSFCVLNDPIRTFYGALQIRQNMTAEAAAEKQLHFDYPIFELFGVRINIQPSVFGVRMARNPTTNRSELVAAELLSLTYKAGLRDAWTAEDVEKYEMEVFRFFNDEYKSRHLKIRVMNPTSVQEELVRGGYSLLPAILLGFCILAVTSVVTVLLSAAYFQQASVHKISLAMTAVTCPLMASMTALGLMFFGGMNFSSVLCITPFLILAIGIDDAYLMLHSWQRVTKMVRENPTTEDSVAYRLSLVLIETGPAILISALTNFLADVVGAFTGSSEVTTLCIGNCVSIVVDFFFQITLFTAVLAVAGRLEMEAEERQKATKKNRIQPLVFCPPLGDGKKKAVYELEFTKPAVNRINFHDQVESGFQSFVVKYVEVVTNTLVSSLICVCWLLFFVFSIYWLTQFRILLTFDKMVATDSPLLEINRIREQKMLPQYTTAQVFVEQPGDFSDGRRLDLFLRMVDDFESLPESWGPNSTLLFVRDFLRFQRNAEGVEEEADENGAERAANSSVLVSSPSPFNTDELPAFFNWPEYSFWRIFVKTKEENNHTKLDTFFFQLAFHGTQLSNWDDRGFLLHKWREVADRYLEFKLSVYNDEAIFLDLIDNMPTDAWQSALGTLVCISLVCFLFMRDSFAVAVATAIVGSVMIGMLGTLSFCGVTLDPICLASIIISIGFSIDVPTHLVYHCAGAEHRDANVRDRLIFALSSVGFPACQASLSTSLVIVALFFVPLYMAWIFVRVMYLCIALCLVHSLLVLPAMFSLLERIQAIARRSKAPAGL